MIETFSPGIEGHARCIRAGLPYAFPRYGEGEWRVIVPEMHVKKQRVFSEWHAIEAQDAMRHTLLDCHTDTNYCPAIWHQRYYARDGRNVKIEGWLGRNHLDWIKWWDGRVWRRAIETNTFHHIVSAMRESPLPLVFVGPEAIHKAVDGKFKIAKFIPIHPTHAYNNLKSIVDSVLSFGEPATISFSAGGTANILIHTLFPEIWCHSLLIDFGASWEVLSGRRIRPYARNLTRRRIGENWEGK